MEIQRNLKALYKQASLLLLTLFFASTLVGCQGCGSSTPKGRKPKKEVEKGTNDKGTTKKAIILFHGMGDTNDLKYAEPEFEKHFPKDKYAIIRLVRKNSTEISTTKQAEEAYQALKAEMEKRGLTEKTPICLLGNSHGGLVAVELYRRYKTDLNIQGIITHQTPLEGAPAVMATDESIRDFKTAFKDNIPTGTKPMLNMLIKAGGLGDTVDSFIDNLNLKGILIEQMQLDVINDLTKNSQLLKDVHSTLSNINIPVLILGGKVGIKEALTVLFNSFQPSVGSLIRKNILDTASPKGLADLEMTFGAIIGDKQNDAFIPFYSQMGEHIPHNPKVERKFVEKYSHFDGITKHQEVFTEITNFITEAFNDKK
jgi:esterase/lipase